jgi:hypothetical protein
LPLAELRVPCLRSGGLRSCGAGKVDMVLLVSMMLTVVTSCH